MSFGIIKLSILYFSFNFVHVNSPFSENDSEIESDGQMRSPPPKIAKVVESNDTPECDYERTRRNNIQEMTTKIQGDNIKAKLSSILPTKKPKKAKNIFLQDPVIARHFSLRSKEKKVMTIEELAIQEANDKVFAQEVKKKLDEDTEREFPFKCFKCGEKFELKVHYQCHLDMHFKPTHPEYASEGGMHNIFDTIADPILIQNDEEVIVEDQLHFPPTARNYESSAELAQNENIDIILLKQKTELRKPILKEFLTTIVTLIDDKAEWSQIHEVCTKLEEWDWNQFKGSVACQFDPNKMEIDENALKVYKSYGRTDRSPIYVPHDKNSLYSSMSVLICGETFLSLELRVSTVVAIANKWAEIYQVACDNGLTTYGPTIDHRKELRDTACEDTTQKTLQFIGMTWAIEAASFLIYPLIGLTDISALINQGFFGACKFEDRNYFIMWSGEKSDTNFIPDHFIPLVPADLR